MNERLVDVRRNEPLNESYRDGEPMEGASYSDLDNVMDTMNITADEARKLLELDEPTLEGGPSVQLVDRADALGVVMDALNKQSSVNRIDAMRAANRDNNRFDRSYNTKSKADRVLAGMKSDAKGKHMAATAAYGVLVDRETLSSQGVPEEQIQAYEADIRNSIYSKYGPGRVSAKDREKAIAPAHTVAEHTSGIYSLISEQEGTLPKAQRKDVPLVLDIFDNPEK